MGVRSGRSAVLRLVRFLRPAARTGRARSRASGSRGVFKPLLCLGSSVVSGYGASIAVAHDGDLFGADHLGVFRAHLSCAHELRWIQLIVEPTTRFTMLLHPSPREGLRLNVHTLDPPLLPRLGSVFVRS